MKLPTLWEQAEMPADAKLCGVICVNKPSGPTSHDIVHKIKRLTGLKAGHTGTLDPAAEGVLPVCLGKATKIADYISVSDKKYTVEIIFGSETDTQDATGTILREAPLTADIEAVREAILSFKGDYMQIPPMYSAIKKDGKRLYELAREGREEAREARHIKIHEIDIIEITYPHKALISVRCSKGAYMRTLCHDIGLKLSSLAHMGRLIRTEAGGFGITGAMTLESIETFCRDGRILEIITPVDKIPVFSGFEKVFASAEAHKTLINGGKIKFSELSGNARALHEGLKVLVYDFEGRLAGVFEVLGECVKPLVMLR